MIVYALEHCGTSVSHTLTTAGVSTVIRLHVFTMGQQPGVGP